MDRGGSLLPHYTVVVSFELKGRDKEDRGWCLHGGVTHTPPCCGPQGVCFARIPLKQRT